VLAAIRFSATRLALALGLACLAVPADAKVTIQEVRSGSGVTGWLVEDYAVPMVTIRFAFEGGWTQDPPGKEGLTRLMTGLFDEGAGSLDSDAFQKRLDDAGAEMRFGADRDTVYGTMRMLADNQNEAFELLRLAIQEPRFDEVRSSVSAPMVSVSSPRGGPEPSRDQWAQAIYGDPLRAPDEGTRPRLPPRAADLKHCTSRFAREPACRDRRRDRRRRGKVRDRAPVRSFAREAETPAGCPCRLEARPGAEGDLPAAPDYPATRLSGHVPRRSRLLCRLSDEQVLGGGTLNSRLFDEVREKRGLAYSVSSGLVTHEFASGLVIGTSTRSDRAGEALEVIRAVVREMASEGPTEAELAAAKKYVVGSYALSNLDSSRAIASTLVSLQLEGLPIDYIDRRAGLINAVTLEEVRSVAARLLTTEPAIMIVGPPPEEDRG